VREYIRERVVDQLAHIDVHLANAVAGNLGITLSEEQRNIAPPKEVNGLKKIPRSACMPSRMGHQRACRRRVAE
jgi:catalase